MNFGFNGRNIPFGFMGKKAGGNLVDGSDGDLVVLNGQTYQLTAGNIYSFNSIDVQAGGILEIVGGSAITQVGCAGSFIVNGTFRGKTPLGTIGVGLVSLGADNWFGQPYSHTQNQSNGGNGGTSLTELANSALHISGGSQVNGNGGGGGGSARYNDSAPCGIHSKGGDGESAGETGAYYTFFSPTQPPETCYNTAGGFTGGTLGNQGGNGHNGSFIISSNLYSTYALCLAQAWTANSNGAHNPIGGGGGGGGASIVEEYDIKGALLGYRPGHGKGAGGGGRGEHGRHVYILAESGISGSGSIDFSGNVGYNGGGLDANFGSTAPFKNTSSCAGGGGGAGGSGGAVWIRHGGSVTPTVNTSGGGGGSRSPQGAEGYHSFLDGGVSGSAGSAGITDIQSV